MVINTKQPYACLLIERCKVVVMFFLLVVATKTVFSCWTSDLFIMHTLTVFPEIKDTDSVHCILIFDHILVISYHVFPLNVFSKKLTHIF